MKVLVTGAGALLGQGVLQSLLKSQLRGLQLVAVDPSPLSAGLYWVDENYLVPKASDPSFMERIEELLARTHPDVVIPGTDVELQAFAQHRDRLERTHRTRILVSNPKVVAIADDKYETFRFFREHGFDAPDSCLAGEEDQLVERVGFPLIVKPRVGARSVGVVKVGNVAELKRALAATPNAVVQECVGADEREYTAGTLTFDGRCDARIVMRRDLRDGNTYRAWVDQDPALERMVSRFAQALGAYGPANFQFRIDARGAAKVFEINARFSGTTPLRMHAGFNEVEMCIRHLLEGTPVTQPALKQIVVLRHWSETVVDPQTLVSAG